MNSNELLLLATFVSAIFTTSCQHEVIKYCYGLNETNMPAKVVIVENSRFAERYDHVDTDVRLRHPGGISGPDRFIAGGSELLLNYVSCKNIDGFEDVESLHFGKIRRKMGVFYDIKMCDSLEFEAESDDGGILLTHPNCGYCPDSFTTLVSKNARIPSMLGPTSSASSYVSISQVYGADGLDTTPLEDDVLYSQRMRENAPPSHHCAGVVLQKYARDGGSKGLSRDPVE